MNRLLLRLSALSTIVSASCGILGPDDTCPKLITGTYDLILFEGESLPAQIRGKTCFFMAGCSSDSFRILAGELILSEDGTFEESGLSQNLAHLELPQPEPRRGTYQARESSVDFTLSQPGQTRNSDIGRCTQGGLKLESQWHPFHFFLFREPRREWEKR